MQKIQNEQGETVKAGCVVFDKQGRLLVVTPRDRGTWGLPKGHAEPGESFEEVAIRETFEETGYKVRVIRQLDDLTYRHPKRDEKIRVHLFLAEMVAQTGQAEEDYKWINVLEARELLYPNIVEFLARFSPPQPLNIAKKLRELNLPTNSHVVVGSGIMDALGIRGSSDIDLVVSPELYKKLRAAGWQTTTNSWGKQLIAQDVFEADVSWDEPKGRPNLDDLLTSATVVGGIPYVNLERLLAWKKHMNRAKDRADIKLIEAYLEAKS